LEAQDPDGKPACSADGDSGVAGDRGVSELLEDIDAVKKVPSSSSMYMMVSGHVGSSASSKATTASGSTSTGVGGVPESGVGWRLLRGLWGVDGFDRPDSWMGDSVGERARADCGVLLRLRLWRARAARRTGSGTCRRTGWGGCGGGALVGVECDAGGAVVSTSFKSFEIRRRVGAGGAGKGFVVGDITRTWGTLADGPTWLRRTPECGDSAPLADAARLRGGATRAHSLPRREFERRRTWAPGFTKCFCKLRGYLVVGAPTGMRPGLHSHPVNSAISGCGGCGGWRRSGRGGGGGR